MEQDYRQEFLINDKKLLCEIYNCSVISNFPVTAKSVNVIITSPPYFGQRIYCKKDAPLVEEEIGREKKLQQYLENLYEAFLNLYFILADDGVFWLNIGFISDKKSNLIDLPSLVKDQAIAAGFNLKNIIVFKKNNSQPNAVKHRSSIDYEMLYMFSKVSSTNYFYNREGYLEFSNPESMLRTLRGISSDHKYINGAPGQKAHSMNTPREVDKTRPAVLYRYARGVWDFNIKHFNSKKFGCNIDHFAVMPLDLVNRMLDLTLSKYGRCRNCKSQIPVFYNKSIVTRQSLTTKELEFLRQYPKLDKIENFIINRDSDFPKECVKCKNTLIPNDIEPSVVFDPFCGSGTTLLGSLMHNANCVGLEINKDFIDLSAKRLAYEVKFFCDFLAER